MMILADVEDAVEHFEEPNAWVLRRGPPVACSPPSSGAPRWASRNLHPSPAAPKALDTIAAVLPIDRRDNSPSCWPTRMSKHWSLVNEGMGQITLRAHLRPRLLEAWSLAATG